MELPEASMGRSPYVAVEGRGAVSVFECREIVQYCDCRLCLRLTDTLLTIEGRNLTMKSYGTGTIRISGRVDALRFEDLTKRKEKKA